VLVLLGADPLVDFPDRELASKALSSVPVIISLSSHLDASAAAATVVLPVAADGERSGTTTNLEGRVTRLAAKVTPPGVAWAPWVIAAELAARLGGNLGLETLDSITDEIAAVAPAYAGLTAALLGEPGYRDGVVVPIGLATHQTPPRPLDPIATPGITSVLEQGAPLRVGTAQPAGGTVPSAAVVVSSAPTLVLSEKRVVAPRLDAYSHRLVLRRALFDEGTLVQTSSSMAGLATEPVLAIHPGELAKLGLNSGDQIRIRSARGAVVMRVSADVGVDRHVVAARFTQDPSVAGDIASLLDASTQATDVRMETVS
jgi:NADH-quinone oxidoreductase subunit G